MERKFSRYLLFVISVFIIALWVDHYQGKWLNNYITHWLKNVVNFFEESDDNPQSKSSGSASNKAAGNTHDRPALIKPNIQPEYVNELHNTTCSNAVITDKQMAERTNKQKNNLIFSWEDDNGVTHFSDTLYGSNGKSQVHEQYRIELKPFELSIVSKKTLPINFKRDITVGIKKIYEIISSYIDKKYIKPVNVNLQFSHSKRAYQAIQHKKAPGLGASQGFYSGKHNLAMVWYKNAEQAKQTALHESAHVINSGLFGSTPRWLNEGLAEYFETVKIMGLAAKISPLDWKNDASVKRISLSTLLNGTNQHWSGKNQSIMYSASHSFVHFLMSTPKGKKLIKNIFQHLAQTRCATSNIKQFFKKYPRGIKGLERDWHNWMQKGKYRTQSF
ncbi:DUF1570 domain-containing protein [Parashewanella spongiae]|uniref:DUF1570 domain-containing protein n=2 Tax=Parashewanella spongiae TaxID=342950 RepID=A0A3A6T685_9GAMM|nr:DUF1570 domain-containing protein [Parashewanella spongiae]MCL1080132.1 DUF1570 domain-containing protein [Parashewanella spongiae]RJY04921.1 DUF1570 domain-containing protein [Parashewanella spongiae]